MSQHDLEQIAQLLFLSIAAVMVLILCSCSAGRSSFEKGLELERQGQFEAAMQQYAEALKHEPDTAEYRLKLLSVRSTAAAERARKGDARMAAADYTGAAVEYQAAAMLDPGISRYGELSARAAEQQNARAAWQEGLEAERLGKTAEAARLFGEALALDAGNPQYQAAVDRVASKQAPHLKRYELKVRSNSRFTLRFREARIRELFKAISQLSGISFIFDDEVKELPVTINLTNATFEQALELLTSMNRLGFKVLNEWTVLLYPRTPEKVKQYEELVVRTFQLRYLDAKKAINLIRNLLQVRKLQLNEEGNTLVLRDTAEMAEVVGKILEANDFPESEVVLDVEVVEVNSKNVQDLGLLLSDYSVSLGAFSPAGKPLSSSLTTKSDAPTPVDVTQLIKAFSIKGFGGYVTVPSAQYNLGKTLTRGNILSNPKIRVRNQEKARFSVGQRVPVQTTTTTGTIASTNVQYVDVGIKLNAEPTIQLSREVVVKLALEVSSVLGKETSVTDGTTLLTIGTRNLDTVLSLKDGETVIIGGLIQNSDTDSKNKVFLLGDLPLLGDFLSNNSTTKEKNELLLAITPRLVRGSSLRAPALAVFTSGQEDVPSLQRPFAAFAVPAGEQEPEPQPAASQPLPTSPVPPPEKPAATNQGPAP